MNYSLLALGDSYTIGECVESQDRFPDQTAIMLQNESINIGTIKIIATTGWTTDELKAAILAEKLTGTYDMVTLLIGVNNQYRGRDLENYLEEFRELLTLAAGFSRKGSDGVFVLSIPDWGVTPFAEGRDRKKIASEIDAYNAINKAETIRTGAHYIDITDSTRLSPEQPFLLATDGLHPSRTMYTLWAKRLSEAIKKTI